MWLKDPTSTIGIRFLMTKPCGDVETEKCIFTVNGTNPNALGWIMGLNPRYDWIYDAERAKTVGNNVQKVTRCRNRKCNGYRFYGTMEVPSRVTPPRSFSEFGHVQYAYATSYNLQ